MTPPRRPAVIAYHLVWTAYGTWLPNDPRGSGSHHVATPLLGELGELHYRRRRIQPSPAKVRAFYVRAEQRLKLPVIRFTLPQIEVVAGLPAQEWAFVKPYDGWPFSIRKH